VVYEGIKFDSRVPRFRKNSYLLLPNKTEAVYSFCESVCTTSSKSVIFKIIFVIFKIVVRSTRTEYLARIAHRVYWGKRKFLQGFGRKI
jgi:hypothetical protein